MLAGSYASWRCPKCRQPMVIMEWQGAIASEALVRATVMLMHAPDTSLAVDIRPGARTPTAACAQNGGGASPPLRPPTPAEG